MVLSLRRFGGLWDFIYIYDIQNSDSHCTHSIQSEQLSLIKDNYCLIKDLVEAPSSSSNSNSNLVLRPVTF